MRTDRAVKLLEESSAERCAEIREKVGEEIFTKTVRLIVLAHLDEAWSDHLAMLDDVREGIHLRALARESPLEEFRKIANDTFDPFFEIVYGAAGHLADAAVEGSVKPTGPRHRPDEYRTRPLRSEADRF